MAANRETVVPFDIGFLWETGAPEPVLIQSPSRTFLIFHAVRDEEVGHRIEGTGVVEIVRCIKTQFGYPNDEALPGHPLCRSGLGYYGVFEVLRSSWVRQMAEQNRVAFPQSDLPWGRHFIFTFHDETFECVCDELRPSLSWQTWNATVSEVTQRILNRSS